MSENELVALTGLVAALLAAILTSVAQPLITARISSRPRIAVKIKSSKFALPEPALDLVRAQPSWPPAKSDNADASRAVFGALRIAGAFYEIEIENLGRVTCKNMSLNISSSNSIIQLGKTEFGDTSTHEAQLTQSAKLGDMQPGQKIRAYIWSMPAIFGHGISITGDDLHGIKYINETLRAKPPSGWKNFVWMIFISFVVALLLRRLLG